MLNDFDASSNTSKIAREYCYRRSPSPHYLASLIISFDGLPQHCVATFPDASTQSEPYIFYEEDLAVIFYYYLWCKTRV